MSGSGLLQPGPVPSAIRPGATPIERWMRPFVRLAQTESTSGFVLLACAILALIMANSPWATAYAEVWQTRIGVIVGDFELRKPLLLWINDGLMTVFFFVVGLEIKRELIAGELRERKKAALPVMAALGGMVVPALLYFTMQRGRPGEPGWGIPMATDIAFVVGFLAMLGPRVPLGLRILLLSLAIADDIGAVLVIAIFYSSAIAFPMLGIASLGFALTLLFSRIGVRHVPIYVIIGAAIWLAFLKSGVHPTVAGVLLGLLTPARARVADHALSEVLSVALDRMRGDEDGRTEHYDRPPPRELELAARESASPLDRLEARLHPWVAFAIMPAFALANAGVSIQLDAITHPVALAVAVGLVVGKPLGIVTFSWFAVRMDMARLPTGVDWKVMVGAGCLAGIGFTMSLFIASLALVATLLEAGKIGTLIGSAISAVVGCVVLRLYLPKWASADSPSTQRHAVCPES